MIATYVARRCRIAWLRAPALCIGGGLLFAAVILGVVSWATFPAHAPFSIDSHPEQQVSARYTAAALLCFLFAMIILIRDIDRRIRHRSKK